MAPAGARALDASSDLPRPDEGSETPFAAPPAPAAPGPPPSPGAALGTAAPAWAAHLRLPPPAGGQVSVVPEGLGQVGLGLEGGGDALRLVLDAARPDTADLLRRHLADLRADLRAEGLGSIEVAVGGGSQGGSRGPGGEARSGVARPADALSPAPPPGDAVPAAPPHGPPRPARAPLDLRL